VNTRSLINYIVKQVLEESYTDQSKLLKEITKEISKELFKTNTTDSKNLTAARKRLFSFLFEVYTLGQEVIDKQLSNIEKLKAKQEQILLELNEANKNLQQKENKDLILENKDLKEQVKQQANLIWEYEHLLH